MDNESSVEAIGEKLEATRLPNGVRYVQLDARTSAYYNCRYALAKSTICTKTIDGLPLEGFIFPPGSYFAKDVTLFRTLVNRFLSCSTHIHSVHNFYVPAIKIKVVGAVSKDGKDFTEGSTLEFYTGILFLPAIAEWQNWRPMEEIWTADVWEDAGFDYRRFQERFQIPDLPMETMEFAKADDVADMSTKQLCDLIEAELKPWGHPDFTGVRPSRFNAQEASDLIGNATEHASDLTFLKKASKRPFSAIANVTERIQKHKLLLAVNFLFSQWETAKPKVVGGHRCFDIVRLGLKSSLSEGNMGKLSMEAGCKPTSEKILIEALKRLRRQALKYYEGHPAELAKVEEEMRQWHAPSNQEYSPHVGLCFLIP